MQSKLKTIQHENVITHAVSLVYQYILAVSYIIRLRYGNETALEMKGKRVHGEYQECIY